MEDKELVLTDVDRGIWVEQCRITDDRGSQQGGAWSVAKHVLRGGPSDGVDVVEVDNGVLSISILPTRGMGIWRGRCRGIPLGWRSPVERPVHPSLVRPTERGGLGWLDGFNEWLCRCGLAWNGPPGDDGGNLLTLHGRIANCPAHRVEVRTLAGDPGSIAITGVVDETSMFGSCLRLESTLTTQIGSKAFTIVDRVTNLAGHPGEMQLLYHLNTGRPFLEKGAHLVASVAEMSPRDARAAEGIAGWSAFAGPTAGYSEQVCFATLRPDKRGKCSALLRNAAGDLGLRLSWDAKQLPCFSLWKCAQAEEDGYVAGLEPATNFPNFKAFEREQGRVVMLQPGESREMRLDLTISTTSDEVAAAERETSPPDSPEPRIHQRPQMPFAAQYS